MDSNVVVEIVKAIAMIVAAVFGAGGLVVKWLDRKIKQEKGEVTRKELQREEQRKKRYVLERDMRRNQGRWMFWVNKGIKLFKEDTGKAYWNGEVEKAHEQYVKAEDEYKKLDSEQLSDHMNE